MRHDDIYRVTIEKSLLFHIMFYRLFILYSDANHTLYSNIFRGLDDVDCVGVSCVYSDAGRKFA